MNELECVPNFSEGNDNKIIQSIAYSIDCIPDVKILNIDSGKDANRTVITFIGSIKGVQEAAFQSIKKAAELINMRTHVGTHPRIGATDVCPFIPLNAKMNDAINVARSVASRVSKELNIPTYCYEEAAFENHKRNLANCRHGEYEGIPEKLKEKKWHPDFGSPIFNEKSGITIIGARNFLAAFNVNLNTSSLSIAQNIAKDIRNLRKQKQIMQSVKAIGWYIEEYKKAQVSLNLCNLEETNLIEAYKCVQKYANNYGVEVTGSELIGMIPQKYLTESDVTFLNLNDISPFIYNNRIIKQGAYLNKEKDAL